MSISYSCKNNVERYDVYKNKHHYAYSVKKYGKYAKLMAEYSEKYDCKINNWFEVSNDKKIITLYAYRPSENKYFEIFISYEDYDTIKQYYWGVQKDYNGYTYYAVTTVPKRKNSKIRMHRFIKNLEDGDPNYVDHIDGNGLNNTQDNLRVVKNCENQSNRRNLNSNNTSGIIGVYKKKSGKDSKYESWTAIWYELGTNKGLSKSFSINKYGDEKAKELAIAYRKQKELECGYLKALDENK